MMIKTSASARRIGLYDKRGKATHEWTIVYDTIHRSYVEGKLSKSTILTPPLFGDPRYRHQKWRNPRPGQKSIVQILTPIGARYRPTSLGKNA